MPGLLWRTAHATGSGSTGEARCRVVLEAGIAACWKFRWKFNLYGEGENRREREEGGKNRKKKNKTIHAPQRYDGDLVVDFKSHLDINPLSSQFP